MNKMIIYPANFLIFQNLYFWRVFLGGRGERRGKKGKKWPKVTNFKLVSAIFYQIFVSHQMIAPQKLWKMFFISSKKLFLFSRYSDIQIFSFPSSPLFPPVSHCFRGWSKMNLKIYDVINCLSENLITYFVSYLEKVKRYEIETLPLIEY